jgi:hypothetical protein
MNKVRKGVIEHSKYKCRLATENKISAKDIKLNENDRYNIIYRYKQRASLILDENEYGKIQLDVTQVQQATQLSFLMTSPIKYEAELEFLVTKKITEKARGVFTKIMNSTCGIKPSYCASAEFKSFEKEYKELEMMQTKILNQALQYDNENELESMLLKIENQKKSIEQRLIEQINS